MSRERSVCEPWGLHSGVQSARRRVSTCLSTSLRGLPVPLLGATPILRRARYDRALLHPARRNPRGACVVTAHRTLQSPGRVPTASGAVGRARPSAWCLVSWVQARYAASTCRRKRPEVDGRQRVRVKQSFAVRVGRAPRPKSRHPGPCDRAGTTIIVAPVRRALSVRRSPTAEGLT
jgi:hypothetical protein